MGWTGEICTFRIAARVELINYLFSNLMRPNGADLKEPQNRKENPKSIEKTFHLKANPIS